MSNDSSRRDFLTALAASAATASLGGFATPVGAQPAPAAPFDDTWTRRVTAAKHKAVFDSPEVGDGLALFQAWVYRNGYVESLGAKREEVAPVVVFRHAGVILAFDDAIWDKYAVGEAYKVDDPTTKKPARRNPYSRAGNGAEAGQSIKELADSGVTFLACNLALNRRAEQLAKRANADVEAVRAEVRANLAPGVIVQPSGIYAVARAQEVGCVFMRST